MNITPLGGLGSNLPKYTRVHMKYMYHLTVKLYQMQRER